jgi:hypothetical protein
VGKKPHIIFLFTWLKTQARRRDLQYDRNITDYDNEKKSEENLKNMYRK